MIYRELGKCVRKVTFEIWDIPLWKRDFTTATCIKTNTVKINHKLKIKSRKKEIINIKNSRSGKLVQNLWHLLMNYLQWLLWNLRNTQRNESRKETGLQRREVGITLGAQKNGWKIQEIKKKKKTPRIRLEKLKTKSPPRRYCYWSILKIRINARRFAAVIKEVKCWIKYTATEISFRNIRLFLRLHLHIFSYFLENFMYQ